MVNVRQRSLVGNVRWRERSGKKISGAAQRGAARLAVARALELIWKIICGGASFDGPRRRANERTKARAEKSNKQKMKAGPDR